LSAGWKFDGNLNDINNNVALTLDPNCLNNGVNVYCSMLSPSALIYTGQHIEFTQSQGRFAQTGVLPASNPFPNFVTFTFFYNKNNYYGNRNFIQFVDGSNNNIFLFKRVSDGTNNPGIIQVGSNSVFQLANTAGSDLLPNLNTWYFFALVYNTATGDYILYSNSVNQNAMALFSQGTYLPFTLNGNINFIIVINF
jgi:hypothetical protein